MDIMDFEKPPIVNIKCESCGIEKPEHQFRRRYDVVNNLRQNDIRKSHVLSDTWSTDTRETKCKACSPNTKHCKKCGEAKPFDDYRTKTGTTVNICPDCRKRK